MDWRRSKTLFILLLVLLNLFLGGTLLLANTVGAGEAAYITHAQGVLQTRGLQYDGTWPEGPAEAGMLGFENESPVLDKLLKHLLPDATVSQSEDGTRVYSMGSRTLIAGMETDGKPSVSYRDEQAGYLLDLSSDARRERDMQALLRAIGYGGYRFVPDRVQETPDGLWLTYVQPYPDGLLFDNRILFRLTGGGLAEMEIRFHPVQQMLSPVGGGTGAVLTAQQALILSPLRGPLTLDQISFGWGQGDAGELYYSPMWRIITKDGREMRLDAYTGVLHAP